MASFGRMMLRDTIQGTHRNTSPGVQMIGSFSLAGLYPLPMGSNTCITIHLHLSIVNSARTWPRVFRLLGKARRAWLLGRMWKLFCL